MSSKAKERLRLVADRNKAIANENQRMKRFLVACMHQYGRLEVSYQSACNVADDDQLEMNFNRRTGIYTCTLVGDEDANRMGSGSEEVGVSGREGDVGGSLHHEEDVVESTSGEVPPVDQQHPGEDRLLPDPEEVKRGSE